MTSAKDDFKRIVIIGNSGSGKSHLARQLSELFGSDVIHLDKLFWEPGGFGKKRPPEVVREEVGQLSHKEIWIIEGVFGDLAATALQNATTLIFLNKGWSECEAALKDRGSESSKQLDPVQAEKNFQELLTWAKTYYERENSRSLRGHSRLFQEFQKKKFEFQNRRETTAWMGRLQPLLNNSGLHAKA